jgi:hypothetical protein
MHTSPKTFFGFSFNRSRKFSRRRHRVRQIFKKKSPLILYPKPLLHDLHGVNVCEEMHAFISSLSFLNYRSRGKYRPNAFLLIATFRIRQEVKMSRMLIRFFRPSHLEKSNSDFERILLTYSFRENYIDRVFYRFLLFSLSDSVGHRQL